MSGWHTSYLGLTPGVNLARRSCMFAKKRKAQNIVEINAPLEDHPIGARLGPAPLPPPLAQVADTARPLAAGPDPSFTPGETSVLRAIAAELESAGHNVRGFGAWVLDGGGISSLPREISKQAQQLFDLAIRLNDLALARENRDVAIYKEGFALGSSSSS